MSLRWFRILLSISTILVVLLGVFLFDSMRSDHAFPGVRFNGVSVGRNSYDAVNQYLDAIEERIFEEPVVLEIKDESFDVTLDELGFVFNRDMVMNHIFGIGHDMGFLQRLGIWAGSWIGMKTDVIIDDETFHLEPEIFSVFIAQSDIDPETLSLPFNGRLAIEDGVVVAESPRDGYGIDTRHVRQKALALLSELPLDPWVMTIDTTTLSPDVSQDSFDTYYQLIESYLAEDLRLEFQGQEVSVWTPEELIQLLQISEEGSGWFLRIRPEKQDAFFNGLLARDARFIVGPDYQVAIEPSQKGFVFDEADLVATFHGAFDVYDHVLELSTRERTDPKITTEDLEAMGINHVIAQFTTHHDCCQNRVTNIHRMADIVNNAVVMPGESFDLNAYVGERTAKKGFVPAGAIFFGEHVDNVGGGVSQFATTLYNAAYWSGLWIESHKPHSQYFSRYPEGIEATVSWKYPTLRFKNDYTTPIVIKTKYTDSSLTVMILGNNDGRVVVGDHRSGVTDLDTIAQGGEASRIVTSSMSPRYNINPSSIRYIAYPDRYLPGDQSITEVGKEGWTVNIVRSVFYPERSNTYAQTWKTTYVHPTIIQVHSCDDVVEDDAPCYNAE